MTLGSIRSGDVVLAEQRDWRFCAIVVERRGCEPAVELLERRVGYDVVKAREVLGIWRESGGQCGRAAAVSLAAS